MEIERSGLRCVEAVVVPSFGRREELRSAVPSAEWWQPAQRNRAAFLGRGKSQSEDVDLPKINAELFAKIRRTGRPGFDDAEAPCDRRIGAVRRGQRRARGINYRTR